MLAMMTAMTSKRLDGSLKSRSMVRLERCPPVSSGTKKNIRQGSPSSIQNAIAAWYASVRRGALEPGSRGFAACSVGVTRFIVNGAADNWARIALKSAASAEFEPGCSMKRTSGRFSEESDCPRQGVATKSNMTCAARITHLMGTVRCPIDNKVPPVLAFIRSLCLVNVTYLYYFRLCALLFKML